MKLRSLLGLALIVALLSAFGCGGGGDGAAPVVTAVVKVSTTGTVVPVGGALALLNYSSSKYSLPANNPQPDGTNPKVVASGSLGLATGSIVAGTLLSPGHVNLALVNSPNGAAGGEFATVTFTLLPGKTPVPAADFVIAPVPAPVVTDPAGVTIAGTVVVSSATIQ